MGFWKKVFFHSPANYIIATCIGIVMTLVYFWSNDFAILTLGESFINSGIVLILIGLLLLCAYLGAFDTFAYGFHSLRKKEKRKFEDLIHYNEYKREERKRKSLQFMPFIVVGVLVLIIGIFLTLIIR